MSGLEGHAAEHVLRGYIRYLERGATTHAEYAQASSLQAVELSLRVEDMAAGMVAAAEDGEKVDGSPIELLAGRVEALNIQASIHTLGLSTCLVGLALLAAQGHSVPEAPPLLEEMETPA